MHAGEIAVRLCMSDDKTFCAIFFNFIIFQFAVKKNKNLLIFKKIYILRFVPKKEIF